MAFPDLRCIVETGEGQKRHLKRKGRSFDLRYMKYHALRRKWTGDAKARQAYFEALLPGDLQLPAPDLVVDTVNSQAVWQALDQWQPELTICAGTKYIGKTAIGKAGLMLNLHTGFLPDYKGNHCIFFALYDGEIDKVATAIHKVSPELDGGMVLEVLHPPLLPDDNEESIYARCAQLAIDKSLEHAKRYAAGESLVFTPQPEKGRMFRHRDRTPWKEIRLWWRMKMGRVGLPKSETRHS